MNGYKEVLITANEYLEIEKTWARIWKQRGNAQKYQRAIKNAMQIEKVITFISQSIEQEVENEKG